MTNNTIPNVPRELKPCPFCGDIPSENSHALTDGGFKYGAIQCGCGALGPDVRTEYKDWPHWRDAAFAAWNERALLSAPSPAGVDADHVEDVRVMVKAQGVVMPERWNVPRPMWKDARQPYGNPLNHADIEAAEKFNLALDEVARLNAAPVQQVSVPDGWRLVPVEPTPKMIDATWYHEIDMSCGIESQGARNKRIYEAMLIAAPAAPAADVGVNDHD